MGDKLLLLMLVLLLGGGFGFFSGDQPPAKVDPALWERAGASKPVEMLVVLREQADLSGSRSIRRKEEKGRHVYERLRVVATASQRPLQAILDSERVPYRSFFIINALWVKGDRALIRRLAARPEVAGIQDNPYVAYDPPLPAAEPPVGTRAGVTWGISRMRADQVWSLGYNGQGVVVAGADTGYDAQHPALRDRYRGLQEGAVDHNYNWHDAIHSISPVHQDSVVSPELNPCGLDSALPCDDNGHGTHTMGTMIGDDGAGNQIGVAPGARWIACRNMERGYGSPATYIECFQWFLAPTDLAGEAPDPKMAPHVINNSWGCPGFEGCNPNNWDTMDKVVQTLRAAGIVVVASAGNSGNKCGSVDNPPAMFGDAFSVGATRSDDTIASFSSRGPVLADGSGRLKPDVVAPGVSVRSAIPGGGYASFSGTSMAGPHTAGVVALLISANPDLAGQSELIEQILRETAVPLTDTVACGGLDLAAVPNYTYGYGRIDALAAVQMALNITDTELPQPSADVRVFPNPAGQTLSLTFSGITSPVQIELLNVAGQRIRQVSFSITGDGQTETLSLQGLPAGIYVYRIQAGQHLLSGKVVKR